jgi:DNA-binding protein Fis
MDDYTLRATLMPFVKYDIPLDDTKMTYFIQAFTQQYAAVEPVIFERLDNNCHLDFKLFNTYGRARNHYIGDPDSKELLDSVHIRIQFRLSVKDRSVYTQTAESVTQEIKQYFETLNTNKPQNIYISNLIKLIESKHPNVDHLKFLGINDYDANQQYIRIKYEYIDDLSEEQLFPLVPEMVLVDYNDIILTEEI